MTRTRPTPEQDPRTAPVPDLVCPVCGEAAEQQKCKVVCRSATCTHRLLFNCSEF